MESYMKKKALLVSTCILILFSGCLGQSSTQKYNYAEEQNPNKITQSQLSELIRNEGDLLLIDVRSEGEYNIGHLPGAIVIPYHEFETRYEEILDFKDKEVVVYCHVGGMGDHAGRVLIKNGFTNVKNLEGGIAQWRNTGGKIV
jgi:rhodanese-related sulfurtransferase